MKKSNLFKLFLSVASMFAMTAFVGCVKDNEDNGTPFINVTPEQMVFTADGTPADGSTNVFTVESNRPWKATVADGVDWVRLSTEDGEGNGEVTVTVPASNVGRDASVTFSIYNSYGVLESKVVKVKQGTIAPTVVIYNETCGTADVPTANPYQDVNTYTGWDKSGEGSANVSYEGSKTTIRKAGADATSYEGASGPNSVFFGAAPATFIVKNIALTSAQTNLKLTFGGNSFVYDTKDNNFDISKFLVYLSADGTNWKQLTYTKNNGDQTSPNWIFATADFTLVNAVSTLYIKFEATVSSIFRVDDITLATGNGGQSINLGDGPTPPDPDASAITIPELIAKMTAEGAVIDADKDRYVDGVVLNDVAGGNYSFNNLIIATEGSTAAGNGVTLYGSQVEPSTLGLDQGDKVRVTLKKGLAKAQNYNGMYEVTGGKNDVWCSVEKTGTATVSVATITADKLSSYQAMAVKIASATTSAAGVWANADNISSHTLTSGGTSFTVFCKKGATAFVGLPYIATTGAISGLAAVNNNAGQLVPRNVADVAAFNSSSPMIVSVDPTSLNIASTGETKTIAVTVTNKGANQLSVSGLSGLLSATVDNSSNTVTVVGQANTGDAVNQTLTITLAGGNSVTVPVTLAGKGGSDTKGTYVWKTGLLPTTDDSKVDYYYGSSTVTVSGTTADKVPFLRLGKSKFAGAYTTPALGVSGNKKLSFYAVGWTGAPTVVYVRVNGGGSLTGSPVNVEANAGYAGSGNAFTMTLTDSDYYTFILSDLTPTSTVTISTSPEFKGGDDANNKSRAGIIGLQVY